MCIRDSAKATDVAKKHLVTFPLTKETIPHETEVKLSGARVLIKPAAPGTGIIAGGVVRAVVSTTGIRNLVSKSLGSVSYTHLDVYKRQPHQLPFASSQELDFTLVRWQERLCQVACRRYSHTGAHREEI